MMDWRGVDEVIPRSSAGVGTGYGRSAGARRINLHLWRGQVGRECCRQGRRKKRPKTGSKRQFLIDDKLSSPHRRSILCSRVVTLVGVCKLFRVLTDAAFWSSWDGFQRPRGNRDGPYRTGNYPSLDSQEKKRALVLPKVCCGSNQLQDLSWYRGCRSRG